MSYNLINISNNTTGLASLAQGINSELMFGWLGVLILLVASAIIYIGFQAGSGDTGKSLPATAWITTGLAILLRLINLLPDLALFITIVLSAGTLALCIASNK